MRRWATTLPSTPQRARRLLQRIGSPVRNETPDGDRDGVNRVFVLRGVARHGSLQVYVDGFRIHPSEIVMSNHPTRRVSRFTLATAPPPCSRVVVDYDGY